MRTRTTAVVLFIPLLLDLLTASGCSVTMGALAHAQRERYDRRTRRPVEELAGQPPGRRITVKHAGWPAEGGRLVGITTGDSIGPDGSVTARNLILKQGRRIRVIPVKDIQWVQDRSPRTSTLFAVGFGLVIDALFFEYLRADRSTTFHPDVVP